VKVFLNLLWSDGGATSVEYAVMLGLIAVAVVAAIATFGNESGVLWSGIDTKLEDAGLGK
jgi:Flp pilus assembly pilin Flp